MLWGGHHSSTCRRIFNENMADYVFLGPAEYTFPKVLDCLFEKEFPPELKGVLWREKR